ncbi:MAG: GAF domain-containing protein [Anaerolineae bacterium]|nr:GAF domain-containing protein [Anaerolineae bacterium]
MNEPLRLLLVDDETSLLKPLAKHLSRKYHYHVDTATNAAEALEQLERAQGEYHVALIDDLLVPKPGYDPEPLGVILTQRIKARYPGVEIIVFTGWGMESALETLRAGAYRYMAKPLNYDELDMLIKMAADQSRLKEAAREKKILEHLMKISTALLNGQDLSETLDIILEGIRSIGFDRVRLYLVSDDGQTMIGTAQAGMHANFEGFRCVITGDAYLDKMMRDPQPRLFEREGSAPLPYEKELAKENIKQWICVPLLLEREIIGKISMDTKFSQRHISEAELGPIGLFASQAAAAIQKARLRAKELAATAQAERRARKLEAIQQVSTKLSSTLEIDAILESVCQAAVDLIQADHSGLVLLKEPKCEQGRVVAEYPALGTQDETIQVKGVPLEEKLITTKELVNLSEITDKAALGPVGEVFARFDIRSILIVPVILKDKVIGSFSLDAIGQTRTFTQEEVELCQTFADQVAIAVGNARTHDHVKQYAARLDVLYRISDYIQVSEDIDKILHVVLTGVTANYGLSFNRAALLLLDAHGEYLVGRMGVGHIEESKAEADWENDVAQGFDFSRYLQSLERDALRPTPIDCAIRNLTLPVDASQTDIFSQAVLQGRHLLVTAENSGEIPAQFIEAFKPGRPLIVVPLLARDQTIGILVADNKFTKIDILPKDIEAVSTFANTAATAIDNTRLLQETRFATKQISSFFEASNALVSSHDPDKVLQDIVKLAYSTTNATGASLILLDQTTGRAEYLANIGKDKKIDIKSLVRPFGLSMQVLHSGKCEIIEDTEKEKHRINPSLFWNGVRAALCLPFSVEGMRIGVMWLHYAQPRRFSEAVIKALQLYVNQAAIAFDSARRIKQLEYMRRAAEALAGVASLHEVLAQIVHSAQAVLQADSAVILPYDACQNRFDQEKAVAVGITIDSWDIFQKVEPRRGGTAHTIMESQWVGVKNVADEQHYHFLGKTTRRFLEHIKAQSFQGVALRIGDELLGVLYVNFESERDFSDKEQETAQIFANHAALALRNARLLEQVSETRNAAREVAEATVLGDLKSTLNAIVKKTQDVLKSDVVMLYIYEQETQKFDFPPIMTGVMHVDKLTKPDTGSATPSTIQKLLQRDTIYIAHNRAADSIMNDTFAKVEKIQASVGIPLLVRGFKVGVMVVSYRSEHRFIDDELNNIRLFANQAAVAIRNTQLFEHAEKRARIQETLYEAARALSSTLDPQELLFIVAQQAWQLTGASRSSHLARVSGDKLNFVAAYPREHLKQLHKRVGVIDLATDHPIGVVGVTAKTRLSQLISNIKLNYDYIQYDIETRSELAVPILSGREVIGVIDVEHDQYDAFDQEHLHALESLAAQASVAIQNASLFEDAQRKAYLLNMAAQVAQRATAILDIDKLLTETSRLISDNFGFYHTGVFLMSDNKKTFDLKVAYPENDARLLRGHTLHKGQGIVGTVAQSGEALLAPDVSLDPHYICTLPLTRAEIAFPLIARGEVIGVLDVQSTTVGDWHSEDIATLQTMADQLANAIINAQLYQQVNERLADSNVLRDVAVLLAGTLELSAILDLVLVEAMQLSSSSEALVLFWDTDFEAFRQGFKVNRHSSLQYYNPQERRHGISRRIIEQRSPIFMTDTKLSPEVNPKLIQQGCRAFLGVPLLSQGQAMGVLYVRNKTPMHFAERQVGLLEILASYAAVAIDRALQFEEMKKIKGYIGSHTATDWIRMVSTTWGHSIRREVGIARGQVALIGASLPQEQLTDKIRQQLDQLDHTVVGIRNIPITAPLSYEDAIDSIKINATLKTYLERRWQQNRYQSVDLLLNLQPGLDNQATVRASQEWLRRGLELLIDNAVSAMEQAESDSKQITITTRLRDGSIEICIEDTGPGIPDEVKAQLFKSPIAKPEGSKGSGIGLMLARTIFQTYLGEVRLNATSQHGTTMQITLPIETELSQRNPASRQPIRNAPDREKYGLSAPN